MDGSKEKKDRIGGIGWIRKEKRIRKKDKNRIRRRRR